MLLINLKKYLKSRQLVSSLELITRFNLDQAILQDMLNFLICKGIIRKKNKSTHCGVKCIKCNPGSTELYEWIGVS